jgi:hypothetical protein
VNLSALVEYINLVVISEARRLREAELSGDRRAPWGSRDHIDDLQGRISDAEYWQKKCGRGTARRSYYTGVLTHLKNELKSARRANQSLNEKQK